MSSEIHRGAIPQEIRQPWIAKFGLKITYLKFHSNPPDAAALVAY